MLDEVILEKQYKHGDAFCTKISTKRFTNNGTILESVKYALDYPPLLSTVVNRDELVEIRDAINEALNA